MMYNFTLILNGLARPSGVIEDAIYDAGCNDGTLFYRNQIGYIEFDSVDETLEKAIISAVKRVESIGNGIKAARVEPGDLVTSAEIARRLDRSRESVRLLVEGARGSGGFPVPLAGVTAKTRIWSWAEVSRWFYDTGKIMDSSIVKNADVIRLVNEVLKVRDDTDFFERVSFIQTELNEGEKVL